MNRVFATPQFNQKASYIHNNKYDYSSVVYTNSHTKINIICLLHGNFLQTPNSHLNGNGCPKCKIETVRQRCKHTIEIFIQKAIEVHRDIYKYTKVKYINNHTKIIIECKKHGDFEQTPGNHLSDKGCTKCKYEKIASVIRKDKESFVNKSLKIHGNLYDYTLVSYIAAKIPVEIICNKHGSFWQKPNNHLNGSGCPLCKSSRGETVIRLLLEKYSINYIREYRIPDQIYRHRYDFYLPDYNLLIEFHGIQHYKSIKRFGGDEGLDRVKFRDTFKKHLAKSIGIKLISFNYIDLKQLSTERFEEIVLKKIYDSARLYD